MNFNDWLMSTTGYSGPFGAQYSKASGGPGNYSDFATPIGLDENTLRYLYGRGVGTQPATSGPSMSDIQGYFDPSFQGLQTGQQGLQTGQQNLATGQQDILAGVQTGLENQNVLQQDIGTVGAGVGRIGEYMGTPTTEGQTLFGDIGNLTSQVGDLGMSFDQFGNQISDFRGVYEDTSQQQGTTLNDIREQGLSQRESIERQIQDMQPMVYGTNRAVTGSPSIMSPVTGSVAPQTSTTAMAPSTNTALTQSAQALAEMGAPNSPFGVTFMDPRDTV